MARFYQRHIKKTQVSSFILKKKQVNVNFLVKENPLNLQKSS